MAEKIWIYKLKDKFERLLKRWVVLFDKVGISPNMLTGVSIISALVATYFFYHGDLITGGIFVLIDYVFDTFDGVLAKAVGKTSKMGYLLDHASDYVLRRVWYFALAYSGFLSFELVALAMFALAINVFAWNLALVKKLKVARWSIVWFDWLIIPAVFSGYVVLFFQIMIAAHVLFFIANFIGMLYLNRK